MSTAEFNYTPSQEWVFRAVAGAVKNAAHGHPNWPLDKTIARSIAKRATGTLTAGWRDVLAAAPSERAEGALSPTRPPRGRSLQGRVKRGASVRDTVQRVGRCSPLRLLHNKIGAMAAAAKYTGQPERAAILIEVLRVIGDMREAEG